MTRVIPVGAALLFLALLVAPQAPAQIVVNENISVADTASFPDVYVGESVHLGDTPFVTPLIQVAAPVVDFSAGSLGFTGQGGTLALTVSSIGQASLILSSATISGSSQFAITQITCSSGATSLSATLPSGGACVLTIAYTASSAPANDNGLLTFNDNAALSNLPTAGSGANYVHSVALSGSGSSTPAPPEPPAVVSFVVNEALQVADALSFPDVFIPEQISVSDQVTIQAFSATTTSINVTGGGVYGTAASATVSVTSPTAAATGNVTLSLDGGTPSVMSLSNGSATFNLGVLKAGSHSLVANFPAQANFLASSANAALVVAQATPKISWPTPAPITYGTALSATQLDATASVPGTFSYSPVAGTVLNPGSQTLSVVFSPTDTTDYTQAKASITLQVLCGVVINLSSSSVPVGGRVTVTAKVISCSSQSQTVAVQFSLSGPAQPNTCGSTTSLMFTTPPFTLPAKTSRSVSFPFTIPRGICPGTYTVSATTLVNGSPVSTSTSTLTITAH